MQMLGKFLNSLVTSLLVSLVMAVIAFSVITGEFPPKFAKFKAGLENIQKLSQQAQLLQKQIAVQQQKSNLDDSTVANLGTGINTNSGLVEKLEKQVHSLQLEAVQQSLRIEELRAQIIHIQQKVK